MFIDFPEVEGLIIEDMEGVSLPKMVPVKQVYDDQKLDDIRLEMEKRMNNAISDKEAYRGKKIAVTAGSRGIPNIDILIKAICDTLKSWGADPFVIAAMGSHGGGTVAGQLEVLRGYGVTEENIGVPVKSTLDVVEYDHLSDGTPLMCNRLAWEADGIVLFNKVKPHTDFHGIHESGIIKMIAIGLGDHKGASAIHSCGINNFPEILAECGSRFIPKRDLIMGIGVVQNAYDEICRIEAADKDDIISLDKELLAYAKKRMGKFKFPKCDILIVDELGKDISGSGMDANITGRATVKNPRGFTDMFDATLLVLLGVTENSHHNACGIGLADITTREVLNGVDWGFTWTNHFNSLELHCSKIPCYANNEKEAILFAIRNLPEKQRISPKIVHIKNTLYLTDIEVSAVLYEEIRDNQEIVCTGETHEMVFDSGNHLTRF